MKKILNYLQGKKTYIVGLAIAVVVALNHLAVIDAQTGNIILGLLGAGGLITLRAAVAKSE